MPEEAGFYPSELVFDINLFRQAFLALRLGFVAGNGFGNTQGNLTGLLEFGQKLLNPQSAEIRDTESAVMGYRL